MSITSSITDRFGRQEFEVLLAINHNRYNFRKQIHLGQISLVETMSKVKNFSILEIPQFFFRISGCCYGYWDLFCDWWIWLSGLIMIGCLTVRLKPTVLLHCPITAVQND